MFESCQHMQHSSQGAQALLLLQALAQCFHRVSDVKYLLVRWIQKHETRKINDKIMFHRVQLHKILVLDISKYMTYIYKIWY